MMEFAPLSDGIWFGILDNGVLIFGAYTGLELDPWINKLCKGRTRIGLGAVIGGAVGNLVSDVAGCMVDPAIMPMIGGIALGCVIPMALIPIVELILNKNCK
jgi:hypothetical protein